MVWRKLLFIIGIGFLTTIISIFANIIFAGILMSGVNILGLVGNSESSITAGIFLLIAYILITLPTTIPLIRLLEVKGKKPIIISTISGILAFIITFLIARPYMEIGYNYYEYNYFPRLISLLFVMHATLAVSASTFKKSLISFLIQGLLLIFGVTIFSISLIFPVPIHANSVIVGAFAWTILPAVAALIQLLQKKVAANS